MEKDNKLIAEFMQKGSEGFGLYDYNGKHYKLYELKYHTSWDWLMPVIEKIESLGYTFEKNYQRVDKDWQSLIVKGNDILYQEFNENSLQCSYYVVVEFIKNQNN